MSRESTYTGFLNHNEILTVPLFNLSSAVVFLERIDGLDTTGTIYVRNIVPKTYDYDVLLFHHNPPAAYYGFPQYQPVARAGVNTTNFALSTPSVPKEIMSGRTCTLNGGNLLNSTMPVVRLNGYGLMVPNTVSVSDTNTSITGQDGAGLPWTIMGWVYLNALTVQPSVYLETNNIVTSYFQVYITTTGVIAINQSGVFRYGSAAGVIPAAAWTHFALVYNGSTIQLYINGVANGAAATYSHGTYSGIVSNLLNYGIVGNLYTSNLAVFNAAMIASDVALYYRNITDAGGSVGDFYTAPETGTPGTSGWGLYGGILVLFTNNVSPYSNYSSATPGLTGITLPLVGVAEIWGSSSTANDTWYYAVQLVESEVVG